MGKLNPDANSLSWVFHLVFCSCPPATYFGPLSYLVNLKVPAVCAKLAQPCSVVRYRDGTLKAHVQVKLCGCQASGPSLQDSWHKAKAPAGQKVTPQSSEHPHSPFLRCLRIQFSSSFAFVGFSWFFRY